MSKTIRLNAEEIVKDRPFTNPKESASDVATLQSMVETLCRLLKQPQPIPPQPRPLILFVQKTARTTHRIVLSRPKPLQNPIDITVVAFCGQKRPGVNLGPIEALDQQLIAEFPQHTDLLSYSTLQTAAGDARNLVLFSRPQGILHWKNSQKHSRAVQMSPDYFKSIRLHEAVLSGGVMSHNRLVLLNTHYYDYDDTPPWRAVRQYGR